MKKLHAITLITVCGFLFFTSCRKQPKQKPQSLSVEKTATIENLDLPECIVIDLATGDIYVSNVVTDNEAYWVDDSNGFISKLSPDGTMLKRDWLSSSDEMPINDPKGMCILNGNLYFNDNNKLKYCSLDNPQKVQLIEIPGAMKLNDIAADGESIWVTDTGAGKAYCIAADSGIREIPAPEGVNGITTFNGKIFAVSWGLHEVYELDPKGKADPIPFGLEANFTNLDGIEVLDDGSFIVSDYKGNMFYSIAADRKTVQKLIELQSPADFALDRKNGLIYVPEMLESRAVILKIKNSN